MIDEIDLAAFLKRLRSRVTAQPEVMKDVLTLIADACVAPEGPHSDALEISKTILEIAYPERVGTILILNCLSCGLPLPQGAREAGKCVDCRLKGP